MLALRSVLTLASLHRQTWVWFVVFVQGESLMVQWLHNSSGDHHVFLPQYMVYLITVGWSSKACLIFRRTLSNSHFENLIKPAWKTFWLKQQERKNKIKKQLAFRNLHDHDFGWFCGSVSTVWFIVVLTYWMDGVWYTQLSQITVAHEGSHDLMAFSGPTHPYGRDS